MSSENGGPSTQHQQQQQHRDENLFIQKGDNEVLEEVERNVLAFAYININKLIDTYPADIRCPKKGAIYDKIKGDHRTRIGDNEELGFIRLRGLPYPMRVRDLKKENCSIQFSIDTDPQYYRYDESPNIKEVVWYVSFADRALFGWFHKEELALASEDVRALEHPAVCSLRNCLKDIHGFKKGFKKWEVLFPPQPNNNDHTVQIDETGGLIMPSISNDKPTHDQFNPVTSDGANRPTPILIVGAPRMGNIRTGNIYGNKFRQIDVATARNAAEQLPVTYTNFISIEALDQKANPEVRQGSYTIHQLRTLLRTAMSGFAGARAAIQPQGGVWPELIIKTGLWGCGVYGNNPGVICLVQLAAAHFVGVVCDKNETIKPAIKEIKFFIGTDKGDIPKQIEEGEKLFHKCWDDLTIQDPDESERLIIPDKFLEVVERNLKNHENKDLFNWNTPNYE